MALLFADSFDIYGSVNDIATRYTSVNFVGNPVLVAAANTAFGNGQAFAVFSGSSVTATASFGSNEAILFGSLRLKWSSTTASANYFYLTFQDVAANQCTLRWNGDGSINLYGGGATGTLLGSYPGAFVQNSWDSWQFKVVIDNTAGSIELRKNGSAVATISLSSANSRAGSANAYANAFSFGWNSGNSNSFQLDDFFLCSASGAAPNSWPGDVRAMQQTAATTVQSQFTPSATSAFAQGTASTSTTYSATANFARWTTVICPATGTLSALSANLSAAATGHAKMALYDALGANGGPGGLLATSAEIVNPAIGVNAFAVTSGPLVTKGTTYWIGVLSDVMLPVYGSVATLASLAVAYSSGFPAFAAGFSESAISGLSSTGMTVTPSSAFLVSDTTEDADASYVLSGTVGQEDIYTLSPVLPNYAVVAVNYFALWKKTDAGSRTMALSVAANGSADTVLVTNSALSNSYSYSQSLLALDPTGTGWTPTTVNSAQVGVKVTA